MAGSEKPIHERLDDDFERFNKTLRIDKHSLDEEWVDQPANFNEVAQRFATCVSYRDDAKTRLDIIKAELDRKVRTDWDSDDGKLTEAGVTATILKQPGYQRCVDTMLAWGERVGRWQALKEAFSMRQYALRDLVQLHNAGYWAEAGDHRERNATKSALAADARETQHKLREEKAAEKNKTRQRLDE